MAAVGDRVQLRNGEPGTVTDNYLGEDCRGLRIDLDAGGDTVVDQDEVTLVQNKTWWIVLTPTAMRELLGVLVTDEGDQVQLLMGPMEEQLVKDLAGYADKTVDVSVAHGWAQAPAGLEEQYRLRRAVR
jgi:hypothetical protein